MRQWLPIGILIGLIGLPAGVALAAVSRADEHVRIEEPTTDDVFAAGEAVTVTAPVGGELFAAGSRVSVNDRVVRSVFAGGETVTLEQGAGYNAFVAGQTVTINGDVGHDVFAAGNTVELKPDTHVRGSLYVAGNAVTLAGTIDGDVHVVTGQLSDEGALIGGSLTGDLSRTSIFRGGSIGGDFRYRADRDADGIDTVKIAGTTERTAFASSARSGKSGSIGGGILALASVFVLGGLLILTLPGKVSAISERVRRDWGRMFLTGFLTLVVAPVAAIVALMTVIGWPISLVILGAVFLVELTVAHALGTVTLGQLALGRSNADRPWLALGLGALIVAIISNLPAPVSWIASTVLFFGLTVPALGAGVAWTKERLVEPAKSDGKPAKRSS
jgi:hypothetical protein